MNALPLEWLQTLRVVTFMVRYLLSFCTGPDTRLMHIVSTDFNILFLGQSNSKHASAVIHLLEFKSQCIIVLCCCFHSDKLKVTCVTPTVVITVI